MTTTAPQSSFVMSLLGACLAVASVGTGCKTTSSSVKDLTPPPAGSVGVPLEIDKVADGMINVRKTFYDSGAAYSTPDSVQGGVPQPPGLADINICYEACPVERWPDVMCVYYCQYPTYSRVAIPNIRACFSQTVRTPVSQADGTPARFLTYTEAYDYCVYQDSNIVVGRLPAFDLKVIAANKAAGNKIGPLKWVDDNQPDLFKYLMFTNGDVGVFTAADQATAMKKFFATYPVVSPAPSGAAPAPLTGPCGGTLANGACWYPTVAASAGDCNSACAAHGGVSPATSYNFGGSAQDCASVVNAMTGASQTLIGTGPCDRGYCGCIYTPTIVDLCTSSSPSCFVSNTGRLRACACNN